MYVQFTSCVYGVGSIICCNPQKKRKEIFKDTICFFLILKTFKIFFGNNANGRGRAGWVGRWGVGGRVLCVIMSQFVRKSICRSPLTNKLSYIYKAKSDDKIWSSIIKKALYTVILLITLGKQMGNNCAPCFNRTYCALIPYYIKLPC